MNVQEIVENVSRILKGKEKVVELSLVCFLAEGHLLLEDIPGVGKTTLALSLSKALGLSFARIQFTSDLLPSDIIGVSVYDQSRKSFVFKHGPIFNNVVLADEINRATPKTQSALLEAMAEKHVSVDGVTYELPYPFFVIATQNPVEQYGTYPLPESQLDRFSMRLSLGYPDIDTEIQIIRGENPVSKLSKMQTSVKLQDIVASIEQVKRTYISQEVGKLIVDIARFSRSHPELILGCSTRGAIHLANCSRALAYVRGRDFVIPEDVIYLAPYVLTHRLITRDHSDAKSIVEDILSKVKIP